MVLCFAFGCSHKSGIHGCSLLTFPTDETKKREWIRLCRNLKVQSVGDHEDHTYCIPITRLLQPQERVTVEETTAIDALRDLCDNTERSPAASVSIDPSASESSTVSGASRIMTDIIRQSRLATSGNRQQIPVLTQQAVVSSQSKQSGILSDDVRSKLKAHLERPLASCRNPVFQTTSRCVSPVHQHSACAHRVGGDVGHTERALPVANQLSDHSYAKHWTENQHSPSDGYSFDVSAAERFLKSVFPNIKKEPDWSNESNYYNSVPMSEEIGCIRLAHVKDRIQSRSAVAEIEGRVSCGTIKIEEDWLNNSTYESRMVSSMCCEPHEDNKLMIPAAGMDSIDSVTDTDDWMLRRSYFDAFRDSNSLNTLKEEHDSDSTESVTSCVSSELQEDDTVPIVSEIGSIDTVRYACNWRNPSFGQYCRQITQQALKRRKILVAVNSKLLQRSVVKVRPLRVDELPLNVRRSKRSRNGLLSCSKTGRFRRL